jgi:hypothetical protein
MSLSEESLESEESESSSSRIGSEGVISANDVRGTAVSVVSSVVRASGVGVLRDGRRGLGA